MKYFSVNGIINEIKELQQNAENVFVVFNNNDAIQDKYDKYNYPILFMVIEKNDKTKITWEYKEIMNLFGDNIYINLDKYPFSNEFGVCCIECNESLSKKFVCTYHKRKYLVPSQKILKIAKEQYKIKEEEAQPEVFDI